MSVTESGVPIEYNAVCAVYLCGRWATVAVIDRDGKPRPSCDEHAPFIHAMSVPE
jgi:hypothetical protein